MRSAVCTGKTVRRCHAPHAAPPRARDDVDNYAPALVLTFVVAAGSTIPPGVREAFADPSPEDLPFVANDHLFWSNPDGTVLFAGWSCKVDLGMGPRWRAVPGGLTAFAGHVWPRASPWRRAEDRVAQLAEHLRRHPLESGTDDLLGIFVVLSLDADGRGAVVTDPIGLHPLYRAEVPGMAVVSPRARLVARLVSSGRPARDALAAGELAFCGYPFDRRSGFEGVELVPLGARLDVSRTGIALRPRPPPWRRLLAADPLEAIAEAHADVRTSIHAALAYPVSHRILELSGGKDSRLLLAAVVADGVADQFEYRTYGSQDLPDVQIARRLTERLGLPHWAGIDAGVERRTRARRERLAAAYPDVPVRELMLRLNVGAWDGMRLAWQIEFNDPPEGDRVTLSGLVGETLSTNYGASTGLRNHADLRQLLLVRMKFGSAGLLRRDLQEHYREQLLAVAYDGFGRRDPPQDVIDALFMRARQRRWFGQTQEADVRARVFPLYSPIGLRLAFTLGPRDRHRMWIYDQLYERTCPQLLDEPFAGKGWPHDVVPDRTREPWFPRLRPLRRGQVKEPTPSAGIETRRRAEQTDREVMRRYLLGDRSNPVHDLLDRRATETAIAGFGLLPEREKAQLYGALTAAIWLGGHEITFAPT
jgi:hypothetical protein